MIVCKNQVAQTTTTTTPAPVNNFTLINKRMKWIDAAVYCWDLGQRLAIIRNLAELRIVQDLVKTETWLAGNDFGHQGHWIWAEGNPHGVWKDFIEGGAVVGMDFNWVLRSGTNHDLKNENCMFMQGNGEFNDLICNAPRYFLCDNGRN